MNLERIELESLQVEPYQLREVSRCLLHTILFARALGQVEPREMECEVFDVVYAKCFDRGIENMVELGVEKFHVQMERTRKDRGFLVLSFYDKLQKKNWFSTKEEKRHWERWIVHFEVTRERDKSITDTETKQKQKRRQEALRDRIEKIIATASRRVDHIPRMPRDVSCFPFEITFNCGYNGSQEEWGLINNLQKMVKQGLSD